MSNSIIDEVRAARAAIAADHGYDRAKILEWARAEQKARNRDARRTDRVAESGGSQGSMLVSNSAKSETSS